MTPEESTDAFHSGRFHLIQPRRGHRSGLDALLVAATVPGDAAGRLADLGAGSGAVALAALARCPGLSATLFERDPVSVDRAKRTLALPHNAAFANRVTVLETDVTDRRSVPPETFDHVLANPPFNTRDHRPSPHADRRAAHMAETNLAEWIPTMRRAARPGGTLALIARPSELADILHAMTTLGAIRVLPVQPRANEAAKRVIVTARKGARTPLALLPPLVLHEGEAFTARAAAIFAGEASLYGDE